jgi:hypothetical protein
MTGRQIFGFLGLGFMRTSWRWKQTSRRRMMTFEDERLRLYFAEDRRRLEFAGKRTVIIERRDLKKMFVLNLDSETYSIKPYQPIIDKAMLSINIRETPKPDYPNTMPFDPALFEIPANFKKA